jgi:putative aminopeptidase FrvX
MSAGHGLEYWLGEILPLPTAPFHEERVAARVRRFASERGLRCRSDRAGNLVLEYRRGESEAPVAFTSHLDHPGFEVIESRGRRARLRLLGGVDEPTLRRCRILLHGAEGPVRAELISLSMTRDRRKSETELSVRCERPVAAGDFGHFDLTPLSLARGRISSKALDNVLSVAVILAMLDDLAATRRKAHVYGVFTVAEEVGFVGAMELMLGRLLPKRVPMVVLETSRELPSFKIGAGPVVRVGDRISVFDDALTRWLTETAESLREREPDFRFQRALMPGGMCEASLYQLVGRRACALAVPLANYHNIGPKGAAPEWVDRRDAEDLLRLLGALGRKGPDPGRSAAFLKQLYRQHRRYSPRFRR